MLSALAFMLMHMSPIQVVFQFALGVVSGFIAVKAKRLLPSVLLHASANALALVMQMTPLTDVLASVVSSLKANPVGAVFATLLLAAACGGVLFVVIKYAFTPEEWNFHGLRKRNAEAASTEEPAEEKAVETDSTDPDKSADTESEIRRKILRSNGTFKYWIGVGICIVMFIVNFVTAVIS